MECNNHERIRSRFCAVCGELVNEGTAGFPGCRQYHIEYTDWKWKFCPDCGAALRKRSGGGGRPNEQEPRSRRPRISQERTFRI